MPDAGSLAKNLVQSVLSLAFMRIALLLRRHTGRSVSSLILGHFAVFVKLRSLHSLYHSGSSVDVYPPPKTHCLDDDNALRLLYSDDKAAVGSISGQINIPCPLESAKRTVEGRLKASGLTYTILRPSYFMESWLSAAIGFDGANAKATIYGEGHNPISWISRYDVARFAVASLDNPAARNATLELGGPEALSPLDVVRIFEQVGGRSFEVQHVPVEALQAQQEAATDGLQQSFSALMRAYAQGDAIDMRQTLQAFPLKLITVREYAQRVLGA